MCRYPADRAASTASRVSSGGVWKTPSPMAGRSTPLFSVRVGTVVTAGPLHCGAVSRPVSSPTRVGTGQPRPGEALGDGPQPLLDGHLVGRRAGGDQPWVA